MKRLLLLVCCCFTLMGAASVAQADEIDLLGWFPGFDLNGTPTSFATLSELEAGRFNNQVTFSGFDLGGSSATQYYLANQNEITSNSIGLVSLGRVDFASPATLTNLSLFLYGPVYVDVVINGTAVFEYDSSLNGYSNGDRTDLYAFLAAFDDGITSLEFFASASYLQYDGYILFYGMFGHMPNVVPIPAAVWLLGSGMAGLIALRRKSA